MEGTPDAWGFADPLGDFFSEGTRGGISVGKGSRLVGASVWEGKKELICGRAKVSTGVPRSQSD